MVFPWLYWVAERGKTRKRNRKRKNCENFSELWGSSSRLHGCPHIAVILTVDMITHSVNVVGAKHNNIEIGQQQQKM
jgi:hypothetical protein